jgi:hypothetical protein
LNEILPGYVGEPASYFYRVAGMIYLESFRRRASAQLRPLPAEIADEQRSSEEIELKYECLGRLPAHSREIIHVYYGHDGD